MALAVVKTQEPVTLAGRLAAAQREEAGPRKQVMALQAAYDSAAAADHAEAGRIEPLLAGAHQELLIAEATVTALRTAQETISREEAAKASAAQKTERVAQAQEVIGDAIAAENRALDQIQKSLAQFWACIGAAQDAFREAQAWEDKAGHERRRAIDARVMAGEMEAGPHYVSKPNAASVLQERDQLVRALMQWRR